MTTRSRLIDHAYNEFRALGWTNEDGSFKPDPKEFDEPADAPATRMQARICEHVIDLLKVFSEEGHSGTTAPYTVELFSKLALFKPLGPLQGTDDEWVEVADYFWQNKRCSHVFKSRVNGKIECWDGEAIVFYDVNEDGTKSHYTCVESRQPVTFPYTPTRRYAPTSEREAWKNKQAVEGLKSSDGGAS